MCHIWKIVPDLYEAITKMSTKNETEVAAVAEKCGLEGHFQEVITIFPKGDSYAAISSVGRYLQ